ncbi:MAG: RcpC/CpaB family pilus assembly protein [Acidimicrobiales bacterium]
MAAMRRSTQMLMLGLAVFVIGAGVVILTLSGSDGGSSAVAPTTSTTVQKGTVVIPVVTGAAVPTTFTIPEGKQAVAVQVPFVAGLAGYAKAGDLVNIYATLEKGSPSPDLAPPLAKLVLPAVEVLAVTGPGPGTGAGNTTYLLALDASQAEQAIFLARFESVWMTLTTKGQPVPTTPGRSNKNAL